MKSRLSVVALALSTLIAGHALAADAAKTRAEVRAELAEAIRDGSMMADGQTGVTFKQLNPDLYPQRAVAQGKTRGEVRAERVKSSASNGG